MAMYGLQADINANQGRYVNLFTPGKTKLSPTDVFLGGTATGVGDDQLNGATRVFGDTAQGTALAFNDYNNDLSSQIGAAIAQNAAPRADASRGTPSLARQAQEIQQAQSKISNDMNAAQLTGSYNNAPTLAQKTFEHGVGQDAFTNEYNVGNMMGSYKGASTLSKQAQAIQGAQFNANLAQNESQFGRTLSSGNMNSAADRALSFQKASAPTAAEVKANNTVDAYGDVDKAISQGTPWETIRQNIMNNASGYAQAGLSFTTILNYAEGKYNAGVASSKAYPTSPQGQQQAADNLQDSIFKRWFK